MGGAGLSTCRLTGAGSPTTHDCFPQAIKPKNNNNKKKNHKKKLTSTQCLQRKKEEIKIKKMARARDQRRK